MTKAVRQRASIWLACNMLACCLVPAPAASAAPQEQEKPQDAMPSTRGVSAQVATEAVASQLRPAAVPATRAQDAPADADARGDSKPADDAMATRVAVAGLRGVLFKVTPPQASVIPAEAMQSQEMPGSSAAPAPVPAVRPSYLLGTIHFGTPEEQGIDYALLEQTLSEVETFVNEADIDAAWKPEYDGYRWLPPEQPLSSMLGEDGYAKARALLPKIRAEDLERMKPWSVLALLEARGESGGEATMDARLQRIASGKGKRLAHLESLQEQLQALDCVPADEQARVLGERLRASWILRIESAQAMAWYRARNLEAWLADIDRMEGLGDEARAIEQRARECLLEQRNERWIGQLETLFQDGPCLIAVGAAHLPGTAGLLAALVRNGYRVEALPL